MEALDLSLTCTTCVVSSQKYFVHGKNSVSHMPSCYFEVKTTYFYLIFDISLVFCQGCGGFRVGSVGFRVVPARFRVVPIRLRVVPAGSGRFRVGSVFYIHPH